MTDVSSRHKARPGPLAICLFIGFSLWTAESHAALTMVINTTAKTITLYGSDTVTPQSISEGPLTQHQIRYNRGKPSGSNGLLDLDAAYTATSAWDFQPLESFELNGVEWKGITANLDASHVPVTITGTGTSVDYSGTTRSFQTAMGALLEAGSLPLVNGSGSNITVTSTAPAVPEPHTVGMAALLAGGAAVRRYRTKRTSNRRKNSSK